MLALGDAAAEFPRRSRRGSTHAARARDRHDRARPIRRSTFRSIRAGGISRSTASICWAELDQAMAWPSRRGARPRGVRPCDRQRAARCRRRAALALPRSGERRRRSAAPKAWRSRACHVRDWRVLDVAEPIRCGPMPRCWPNCTEAEARRGFQVIGRQSAASASRAAPTCCAGSAHRAGRAGDVRPQRHAAAGRPVRSSRGAGAERQDRRAASSWRSC